MKHNRWFQFFALLIVASMVLTACATATPTAAPTQAAVPTTAPTKVVPPTTVPTAVPTEEPTAAPTEPPAKNTIIIGTTDKIASLDPADAYATRDWELIKNISAGSTRVETGRRLTIEPGSGH